MKIKAVNKLKHQLPQYDTKAFEGVDLRGNIDSDVLLKPKKRSLVPAGIFLESAIGYEAQIRQRSCLAVNSGIAIVIHLTLLMLNTEARFVSLR